MIVNKDYYVSLTADPGSIKPDLVGAKAYHLMHLNQLDCNVPAGVVLTTKAFEHDQKKQLDLAELIQEFPKLPAPRLMIRSSAVGEDGAAHSFAGQLDSFQVANDPKEIEQGIRKCWQSLSNTRLKSYESNTKTLHTMGVVVQALVEPDYAGVFFTAAPDKADISLLEYVAGHGEKLVQGEVTPITVYSQQLHDYPFNFKKLQQAAEKIKQHFQSEQDIEWLAKDDEIYLVQTRPITTHRRQIFWSSTNLNENYPDVISPLLYSIARKAYYHYYKNLAAILGLNPTPITESAFTNAVGLWGGRLYYNMTHIHQVIALTPAKELLAKSFDDFVGYQNNQIFSKKRQVASKIKFFAKVWWHKRGLEKHVLKIEKRVGEFAAKKPNHANLGTLFHEFIDIRMNYWYHASLADFYAMLFHGSLGRFLSYSVGSDQDQNTLIQAIPQLVSQQPIREMWQIKKSLEADGRLADFQSQPASDLWQRIQNDTVPSSLQIKHYLEHWGYRCSEELTFLKQNFTENPVSFIEVLQRYLQSDPQDPDLIFKAKHKEQHASLEKNKKVIKDKNGRVKSWILIRILDYIVTGTIQAISARERVRLKQAQLYFHFKQVCLLLGELLTRQNILQIKQDIFFLEYEEISRILNSDQQDPEYLKALVLLRKSKHKRQEETPENLSSFELAWQEGYQDQDWDKSAVQGLPACGGVVAGKAVVLDNVQQITKIKKGDILVTKQTDPGWICAFPLISGLVVERGGMLSHGAIVAREFGIPAVVGIKDITKNIKTGDTIEVNGNQGTIRTL